MKRHLFLPLLAGACFMLAATRANAQSMTAAVLTPPCSNNGQIGVTVTGLTPPINYVYSNMGANVTITHSGINSLADNLNGITAYQTVDWMNSWMNPNVWSITASDGTKSAFATITLPLPFVDTLSISSAVCPALSSVKAWHVSGGTPPFSHAWTNLGTSQVYVGNPAAVPNGTYQLVTTDGAGCSVSSPATGTNVLQVTNISNVVVNMSGTSANCTNGSAAAVATGGTGPYTYLWSNGATSTNISGLITGNYNCTVTDVLGCQAVGTFFVPQVVTINFNSSVTNATCLQNSGSILGFVNGGTPPYSFLWSNGGNTQNISSLTGGTYNVQITDANGCKGSGTAVVGINTPINATYGSSPSTCTTATGSATLTISGGTPPYTIVWPTLNITGATISGVVPGTHPFTITDANGCVRTGAAVIASNSQINAVMGSTAAICPANTGSLKVVVSGSNGPFTYLWSNGATASSILNVPVGSYNCVITDAVGCSISKAGSINKNTPIQVGYNTTPASCIFTSDGAITVNALGGTAPYSYVWSNGQTGASATGLKAKSYYSVTITDANGCTTISGCLSAGYNAANTSCYCTIAGTVFADANTNCVLNNGEAGISNIGVQCSGLGSAFTSASGGYSFIVPTGTYTITEIPHPYFPLAQCQINPQVVNVVAGNNCVSTVNFANVILPANDLRLITSNLVPPIPGNVYSQKVMVVNDGTLPQSTVKFGYAHDGQLIYNSCTPWALVQPNAGTYPNWYRTSGSLNLNSMPFNTSAVVNYFVPTNIPMGTQVDFLDSTSIAAPISTSWLNDKTPWNNVNFLRATVVSGYDPNFKEVFPQGDGPQGNITHADSNLTYVIHFQNTGTYFAQNIFLLDTLDPSLDISTLRPGYSDHKFSTTIDENGVLRFDFKNINLPWKSGYGDLESSGLVTYSIKMKSKLPLGTKIRNTAAIYFDYNEPVITNTTINTLVSPVSVKELAGNAAGLRLFPNPAGGHFTLVFDSPETTTALLSILDVSGREVLSKSVSVTKGNNQLSNDTGMLQNGVYFVQLHTSGTSVTKKIVISK